MKNLAGDKDADLFIEEELYLAGIETIELESEGEVPFTIAGRIGNWKLTRAWTYWVARVELPTDGLLVETALELHNKPNPVNSVQHLGQVVRAGGHAGGISPDGYVAQPVYNDELNEKLVKLGYKIEKHTLGKMIWKGVDITYGEMAELCNEGKLDVERYVDCYHIDSQVGLKEFAEFLKSL